MLDWARKRNHVLPVIVGVIGALSTAYLWFTHPLLGLSTGLFSAFVLYLEIVTQLSFRAPRKRKPVLEQQGWDAQDVLVNGCSVRHYLWRGEPSRPVAVLVHGWTSGAVRMDRRALSFIQRGWSVVLIDLPGHGGSGDLPKWTAERCTTILLESLDRMNIMESNLFSNGVWYYGHSMGAFVGLRISKRRDQADWTAHLSGWVFESPMTGYTEIHHETCNILRIPFPLRPLVLAKTIRHFNALNSDVGAIQGLSEADMPAWGLPSEPILLVQADPDERLGPIHATRLVSSMEANDRSELLTVHMLPELRHTGGYTNDARKALVDAWLDQQSIHSSSV